MGGALFASGPDPLYTPRMPPAVYYAVRARCHGQLRSLFPAVATPIDGPAKADYGDVDIMAAVSGPGNADVPEAEAGPAALTDPPIEADPAEAEALYGPLLRTAAARLGAVRAEYMPRLGRVSVAVRWEGGPDDKGVPHIQVDLTLCPSLRRLRWALFRHAHGDLWNILGVAVLQPAGLTADERALWLRVPEIEAHDRRRARVFLTDVPAAVLAFLGLDAAEQPQPVDPGSGGSDDPGPDLGLPWKAPFPSAAALFAYIATSRFYAPHFDATLSRNKDRRRLRLRPLFRQWVEERGSDGVDDDRDVRAAARDAAFAAFPHARPRYEAVRTTWLREQHAAAVRAAVKEAVPATLPPTYRGAVLGAVRQQLFGPSATATGSDPDADPYASWTVDSVTAWVAAHWRELGAAAAPALHAAYERTES